jgi:uncharacterized protein
MNDTFLWLLAILLVLTGIAGTVLPALPGAPFVFGGLLLAAWIDQFSKVGAATLTVLGILAALTFGVEVAAAALGAKKLNASKLAVMGAAVGTVVGLFMGFVGVLFMPFVGAVVGQYISEPDVFRAGKVGLATWLGLLVGIAAKVAIVFVMIGIFAVAYFV